eukprot:m51a1_g3162 hypothetical protein (537) ;mRNA; r:369346-373978
MQQNRLEPAHIRTAAISSYAIIHGAKADQPLRPCPKCCTKPQGRVVRVGSTMYESFDQSFLTEHSRSAYREFVFPSAKALCSSSRLHLGGKTASEEQHELGISPTGLRRVPGPRDCEEGPYIWLSSENVFHGLLFTVGVVVPVELMQAHRVEPAHIRSAAATSYIVLHQSKAEQPLGPCPKCCSKSRCRIIDLGSSMFESYGPSDAACAASPPFREFVFNAAKTQCSSSRLHLGGRVVLVMEIPEQYGEAPGRETGYVEQEPGDERAESDMRAEEVRDGPQTREELEQQLRELQKLQGEQMERVGVVVPVEWMQRHSLAPVHIRNAVTSACVVLHGSKTDDPLGSCPKCCSKSGCRIVEVGSAMYETFGQPLAARAPCGPCREFVFNTAKAQCSSSRLHLGGRVALVLDVRGPDGSVVARVRSGPLNLLSKPPRHREHRVVVSAPASVVESSASPSSLERHEAAAHAPEHNPPEEAPLLESPAVQAQEDPGLIGSAECLIKSQEQEMLVRQLLELVRLQSEQLARVKMLQQMFHTQ